MITRNPMPINGGATALTAVPFPNVLNVSIDVYSRKKNTMKRPNARNTVWSMIATSVSVFAVPASLSSMLPVP